MEKKDIPQQFGQYQVIREIGRGGMGIVYQAVDIRLKKHRALKILIGEKSDRAIKRFMRESDSSFKSP